MNITKNLVTAVLMTIVTTVLLGVVYPLAVTESMSFLFVGPRFVPAEFAAS